MTIATFEFANLIWEVRPIPVDEQIQIECIFLRGFGPAAGAMIAALVQGLAPTLVEVFRETAGEGDAFDLARLGTLDTADPRLQAAWHQLLDALADTGSEVIRDGFGVFTSRLDAADVLRLFELAILSKKVTVYAPGKEAARMMVSDYKGLGELLQHDFKAKWVLLGKVLAVTYAPSKVQAPEIQAEAATG